jgi:hypothetical protein
LALRIIFVWDFIDIPFAWCRYLTAWGLLLRVFHICFYFLNF